MCLITQTGLDWERKKEKKQEIISELVRKDGRIVGTKGKVEGVNELKIYFMKFFRN